MTWKDIKIATLQKMFSADGSSIPSDGSADDYLAGMHYVANEAINLLSTINRYLIKSYVIEHESIEDWKYDMTDLVDDFYEIDKIVFEDATRYYDYSNYTINSGVIILRNAPKGIFTVYYKAYPTQITEETEDDYELPLAKEVVVLLPLYMASQLYKDDDNGIATTYRNEFEVARELLSNDPNTSIGSFTSESGWI